MRGRLGITMVLAALLALGACSDDGGSPAADAESDALADASGDGADAAPDADAEADGAADAPDLTEDVADAADALEEPEQPAGTGTIRGNVFNNTTTTEGTLVVGVVTSLPVTGDPVVSVVIETPSAPIQPYELTDVPLGEYWVVALFDVGDSDSLAAPGTGDLFGSTPERVAFDGPDDVQDNINVEVQ